ncbi:predicted protein [Sclerotinia sclerotiorum 1980 UF-70]|uniref:Uncharacterized protein n=2 Tax=Sclerotinia sclerotiorum (strain ATCC 18683 / 1980 / Ss-1) TaxID=665079 RepID=A7EJP1_SCLS1|nr:predicted protein [Sclerotinia sclerotiorum 1980 UF-70]APA11972.1 hypothetical protein sscle_08g067420 [Sclerotinia sclerotiorum 1980 UF-70]EDO03057.1 predicted protein [Sclerotinia sclerotiorum 1980 UF-70]
MTAIEYISANGRSLSAILEADKPEPKVECSVKEVIKGKGTRVRECKSAALEANELESKSEMSQMIEAPEP